jgi:hypothetical protein
MKVGIRTEAVQFLEKEYMNGIFVAVRVHSVCTPPFKGWPAYVDLCELK